MAKQKGDHIRCKHVRRKVQRVQYLELCLIPILQWHCCKPGCNMCRCCNRGECTCKCTGRDAEVYAGTLNKGQMRDHVHFRYHLLLARALCGALCVCGSGRIRFREDHLRAITYLFTAAITPIPCGRISILRATVERSGERNRVLLRKNNLQQIEK